MNLIGKDIRKNMTIRWKLYLGFSLLMILFLLFSFYVQDKMQVLDKELAIITDE